MSYISLTVEVAAGGSIDDGSTIELITITPFNIDLVIVSPGQIAIPTIALARLKNCNLFSKIYTTLFK